MLEAIVERFSGFLSGLSDEKLIEEWFSDYRKSLYRREGFYSYRDAEGEFEAELVNVESGGRLVLRKKGEMGERVYAFKEVAFVL
jgi:BirA family biotin operon repressor/biotin-[acetyl-CoA-carboxylase] ligase